MKSSINQYFGLTIILLGIGFIPYLTSDAFAAEPEFSSFVADDPDDLDAVLSNGDTLTITFSEATNATNNGAMTRAEIIANFTDGTGGVDWGDAYSGVWNGDSTVLTVTLTDVTNAILTLGATTIEGRSTTNISSAAEGTNAELIDATSVTATLSGNFGLFSSSSSSNGSGCSGDCEEPTLGVDSDGKRLVTNGFTYNGKSVDVERFFTPYPLITVDVGKENKAEFKIYENLGPDNIKHFSFAFGLAKGEIISESKAMIELNISHDGTKSLIITDPENALDNVQVETSEVSCDESGQTDCLGVIIYHTFRAPLDFNIVATDVWDFDRNPWQNYYNHGIEVVGQSMNPPKEYDGINKGHIYHLTETGKTTAVDEFGNSWSLEYGQWSMDYIPIQRQADEITMSGYTRDNSKFDIYKQGQNLLAENTLEQICSECNDESFDKINGIFYYDFSERLNKLDNPEIQLKMKLESERAQKTMDHILDPTLHLKNQ